MLCSALVACSARELEEEGESRRHLAAQWCEDQCTFLRECEPTRFLTPVTECQQSCESDEAWDWTDECGDIKWAFRECSASASCEEHRVSWTVMHVLDETSPLYGIDADNLDDRLFGILWMRRAMRFNPSGPW